MSETPDSVNTLTRNTLTMSETPDSIPDYEPNKKETPRHHFVWWMIIMLTYLHTASIYGLYLVFTSSAKLATLIFATVLHLSGAIGVTAGAHRLWSHRCYKANLPLRIALMLCNTLAFQMSIFTWTRDHRVHHKYTETNADPYNAKRGFFFSHIGWLMVRKHPEVLEKLRQIDMSDLLEDPVVVFQKKHYLKLLILIYFVFPTVVPMFLWRESFSNAWHIAIVLRQIYILHATFLVNSAAHIWGQRPYDKFIQPSQNLGVAIIALGEGWHNYHHVFPWDYKTSELGTYSTNFTTAFIDFFARIGWAYDCKTVSPAMVATRAQRTGDGSHKDVWGWGDKDMTSEDKKDATVLHEKSQ
uniref:Acyl-CoA Delta(11) desaturase n=1 Tax=Cacopsylla melanoneura TaxID=428564 RepID=A0A8D8XFC9_9HEMI